ncbi:hypothetical protein KEHDKFFH_18220 [Marinobacter maroccanus]|uniref:Uncharacterized protein n=1 Tax=Marinobacter maroccanus TaxID=2055143 RepID=A0A2S5Z5L9_9GAMM|nr:hypothetical protein KEHDKFFH_18220 [Marinobacter maroccanus]
MLPPKSNDLWENAKKDAENETIHILYIVLFIAVIFFCLPFIVTKDLASSSVSDWSLVILTGFLGIAAILSYRQNEKQKQKENDYEHFNQFMDLANSALEILYGIEPMSFSGEDPENTIKKWDLCAQKISAANRQLLSIESVAVCSRIKTELQEFRELFRHYLSRKKLSYFVHLDIFLPYIIAYSSNTWNIEDDDYVLFMIEHIAGNSIYSDELMEEFVADFNRISELGYLGEIELEDILFSYAQTKERIYKEHFSMPEEQRFKKPVLSPCPSKHSINTIADFCTNLSKKSYSYDQVASFIRGNMKNTKWTNFEALYIQLNEFFRLKDGGIQSKKYPQIKQDWKSRPGPTRIRVSSPPEISFDYLFNISQIIKNSRKKQ